MADDINIGKLVVEIGADIKDLDKKVDDVKIALSRVGDSSKIAAEALVANFLKVSGAITLGYLAVKKFNDEVSNLTSIKKLAAATGDTIDSLAALKSVAAGVNVDFQDVTATAQAYSRVLTELSEDPTSRAGKALALLGIEIRKSNGEFKTYSEFLPEFAAAMSKYAEGANKSALGTAILTRTYREIAPLVALGADLTDKLAAAKERDGGKTAEAQKAAAEYQKAMNALNAAVSGVVKTFVINFGPVLKTVTSTIQGFFDAFKDDVRLKNMVSRLGDLIEAEKRLGAEVERLSTSQSGDGNWASRTFDEAALAIAKNNLELVRKEMGQLKAGIEDLSKNPLKVDIEVPGGDKAPSLDDLRKVKFAIEEVLADLKGTPNFFKDAFAFDSRPIEDAMARVNAAVKQNIYTAEEASRIKRGLAMQEKGQILDTATLTASTLTAVFRKSKLAASASAAINTAVGITKAMELLPPMNWIQAALIAATGVAQIAAINSASDTGGGGISAAPAGASSAPTTAPATQTQTFLLEGLDPMREYGGGQINALIDRINMTQKDGNKLVIKQLSR